MYAHITLLNCTASKAAYRPFNKIEFDDIPIIEGPDGGWKKVKDNKYEHFWARKIPTEKDSNPWCFIQFIQVPCVQDIHVAPPDGSEDRLMADLVETAKNIWPSDDWLDPKNKTNLRSYWLFADETTAGRVYRLRDGDISYCNHADIIEKVFPEIEYKGYDTPDFHVRLRNLTVPGIEEGLRKLVYIRDLVERLNEDQNASALRFISAYTQLFKFPRA